MSKSLKTSLVLVGVMILAIAAVFALMPSTVMAQTGTATAAPTATPIPFTAVLNPVAMAPGMGEINPDTARPKGIAAPRSDDPTKTYVVFGPGHTNVPPGVPVYVEAGSMGLAKGAKLADYTWTVKGPDGSTAKIAKVEKEVPGLTTAMAFFTPDKEGEYVVGLTIKDDKGATSKAGELKFVATKYVGNTICAGCHKEQSEGWAETAHGSAFQRYVDENVEAEYFSAGFGCARCHTVGYYPVAGTGGWWDVFTNTLKMDWNKTPFEVTSKTKDKDGKEVETKTKFNSLSEAIALNAFNEGGSTFASLDPKVQAVSNIGCESCHGPAGAHVAKPGKDTAPVAAADSTSCNQCHNASGHHTRGGAILNSAHSHNAELGRGTRVPCNSCHSPEGAVAVWKGEAPEKAPAVNGDIGCATCHDPHSEKNTFQLRLVGSAKLPTTEIKDAGLSATCMACHNSESDPKTVETDAPAYPHYSSAAEMINGIGGYEFGVKLQNSFHVNIGKGIINDEKSNQPGNMGLTQVNGGEAPGACVMCHMYRTPGGVWDTKASLAVPGHQQVGGHTFEMVAEVDGKVIQHTEACQQCHPGITDFNFTAKADYDGNGKAEGVQSEVEGMLALVEKAIFDKAAAEKIDLKKAESYPYFAFPKDAKPSVELKGAIYNFRYVNGVMWTGEGSAAAIHNFSRSVGLLQVSYAKLTGADIKGATLLYSK